MAGTGIGVLGVCDGPELWECVLSRGESDEFEINVVLAKLKIVCFFRSGVLSASRERGRRGASFAWKVKSNPEVERVLKSDLEFDAILDGLGWQPGYIAF
jgi:hypothetical protein